VMDCADWRWSGEDERRLLYVAMTRARETLTLMRAEGGRNPYLVDLGTVDGVSDLLPSTRPDHRTDLDREHVTLGPAEVDIGFAGRQEPSDAVHRLIADLTPGDQIIVEGRHIKTLKGQVVGRLAAKTELQAVAGPIAASVTGIMVRTREQTSPEFLATVRTDRWEVVIAELVLSTVPTR
jgi:ATP-dependent DNA helicase RecQ